jgi:hypothetical protein
MPASRGPAALFAVAAGSLLLYSALKGKSFTGALHSVISGQAPGMAGDVSIPGSTGTGRGGGTGGVPPSPASAAKNKAIAQAMCAAVGWVGPQWTAFTQIVGEEDASWDVHAQNPSGAYGIPQALPGSKMASAGPDWQNSAATQIKWMIGYIRTRYGTPVKAQAFHLANGWY